MWHTLAHATELTGRSRRSLYRDMDAGRVSYRVRDDGRREIETSELMRAYGPLQGLAQPKAPDLAQVGTPDGTPYGDLLNELRLLREEVAGLRAELRLIEHKPSAPKNGNKQKLEDVERSSPLSFADLLSGLNVDE